MPEESGTRLPHPALVLITDSLRHGAPAERTRWLADIVREAVLGGVNVVQLREKHLSSPQLIELGARVRDAIAGSALFFVNGDVEAAIALRADGIHLPEGGAATADVRARVGGLMLISRAVHSTDASVRAEREGADLIQFGTLFETASKPESTAAGVGELRRVCDVVSIPVIAVGGITRANVGAALDAGAAGVAVVGAIFDAPDPQAAAQALLSAIARASSGAVARPSTQHR
jgi:thiamine-phosphate pyrophosphorylase